MQVRGNFTYLLASLLGFLAFFAIITEYPQFGGWNLVSIGFELSLFVAVWGLIRNRKMFWFGMAMVALGAVSVVVQLVHASVAAKLVGLFSVFTFYFMTTLIAFQEMFRPSSINLNKIIGSVCIYLLVGLNWAILYNFESMLHPGAFSGFQASSLEEEMFDLIYYSYVTLSTLGYGDITPVSPIARMLAVIEALFGQFYIAILVASMVGTHISRHRKDNSASG